MVHCPMLKKLIKIPSTMSPNGNKSDFIINNRLCTRFILLGLYEQAQTLFEWYKELFDHVKKLKIINILKFFLKYL